MKLFTSFLICALFVLIMSCGPDDPFDAAWTKFESGDYAGSYVAFKDLTDKGEQAYMGLGWTTLKIADSVLVSDGYFQTAATLAGSDTSADTYAGWTVSKWANGDYAGSIDKARVTLRKNSSYVFSHDRRVTKDDIKLHEAYGLYHVGQYQECADLVHELDATWTLTTDIQLLLDELESLYDLYD